MSERKCYCCRHWETWIPIDEPNKGSCCAVQLVDNVRGPECKADNFAVVAVFSGDEGELITGPEHGCQKWEGTEKHLNESDPSREPRTRIHDELTRRGLKVGIHTWGYPWDIGYHGVFMLERWGERRYCVCWLRLEDDKLTATIDCPKGEESKPVTFDWVADEYHKMRAEIVEAHGEPDGNLGQQEERDG